MDISGIADEDGLENARYGLVWFGNYSAENNGRVLAEAAPFALPGDSGNYEYEVDWLAVGLTVSALVYFADDAGNWENLASAATAVVPGGVLESFALVDVSARSTGMTLTDGDEFTLDHPAMGSYGFKVDLASDATVGSVNLELEEDSGKKSAFRIDNSAPYSLYENNENRLTGEGLPAGSYSLNATAYSEAYLGGDPLQKLEVTFTVIERNFPATGAPIIFGTPQEDQTLVAHLTRVHDVNGLTRLHDSNLSYQWLADDIEILDATSPSYVLKEENIGNVIKVRVTLTDDAGYEETLTSEATEVVTAINHPATGAPSISGPVNVGVPISGPVQVGLTLTADTFGIVDDDGLSGAHYAYQWLADDTEIDGATSYTYTIVAADEGKVIKVHVSFTDDEGNDESLTSNGTSAVVMGGL